MLPFWKILEEKKNSQGFLAKMQEKDELFQVLSLSWDTFPWCNSKDFLQKAWGSCDEEAPAWVSSHWTLSMTMSALLSKALWRPPPPRHRINHANVTIYHGTPGGDSVKGNQSHTVALVNNPKRLWSKRTGKKTGNGQVLLCGPPWQKLALPPCLINYPHLIWSPIALYTFPLPYLLHYEVHSLHTSYLFIRQTSWTSLNPGIMPFDDEFWHHPYSRRNTEHKNSHSTNIYCLSYCLKYPLFSKEETIWLPRFHEASSIRVADRCKIIKWKNYSLAGWTKAL